MAIKLSSLKPNPKNPRKISKEALERLKEKIRRNPDGLKARPIVVENMESRIILGGNQRFKALKALGYKEIPDEYVQSAEAWTDAQRREFLVNDNVSDGAWEWETLREDYEDAELAAWGVDDIPETEEEEEIPETKDGQAKGAGLFLKVSCRDESHARKLYDRLKKEGLEVKILLGDRETTDYEWSLN